MSDGPQIREDRPAGMRRGTLRGELGPTLRLAGPVVLAELGWMAMGVVDMIMVGRLGPEAIGAVGIGNILFFVLGVIGLGMLMGLDAVVSEAFGAGRLADCHRWLIQALYLAAFVAVPITAAILLLEPLLGAWGLAPEVLAEIGPYLKPLTMSLFPLLVYFALRRYLQAMNLVTIAMISLAAANLVNVAGNWILIHGRLGMPRLGVEGSGWATLFSRLTMLVVLAGYAVWYSKRQGTGLLQVPRGLDPARLRRLVKLGLPAAGHLLLEVGVFGAAALLAGRLGAIPLAAHEVVLHAASVTFMVPLGISAAGAVRVGQALGRRDPLGASHAGWVAIGLGGSFMAITGLTFLLMPRPILSIFTGDGKVIATALPLLGAAALFQIFDGLQVCATGALRGSGETKAPLFVSLGSYWAIGLPLGYALGMPLGWGVLGIWIGLSAGLIAAGAALVWCWWRRVRRLPEQVAPLEVEPLNVEPAALAT